MPNKLFLHLHIFATLVNITCFVDHHQLNIQQFYPKHLVLGGEWVLLKVDPEDEDLVKSKYIKMYKHDSVTKNYPCLSELK